MNLLGLATSRAKTIKKAKSLRNDSKSENTSVMVARNRTVNEELAKQVIGSWVDVLLTGLGLATRSPPIRSGPEFGKLLIRKR